MDVPPTAASRPKLFALLSPISKLVLPPSTPPTTFLHAYTTTTFGILLLATFQDVLSGGAKESVQVLFADPGTSQSFSAGCALATSLDQVGWNHFSTVLTPLVLSATARYVDDGSKTTQLGFGEVAEEDNALTLLARLAWSGRLKSTVESGSVAVKSWERIVGNKCQSTIKEWISEFAESEPTEEEASRLL